MKIEQNYQCYNEIHKQYIQLKATLEYMEGKKDEIRSFFGTEGDVVFLACGSSYWMSLSAKSTMKLKTGRNSYAVKAGDILLNREEYIGRFVDPIFVCPSRSGSTSEVLEALEILKQYYPDSRRISFVEYENSELEKKSDLTLHLSWANEDSVCQTRSFSNLYLAAILIADILSENETLFEAARRYIEAAPKYYDRDIPVLKKIVEENEIHRVICLGSGVQYGVCIEGAYIVIEVAEFAANYFQMLEYRHGPVLLTAPTTAVFLVSSEKSKQYEPKVLSEIRKYSDLVYAVSTSSETDVAHLFKLEEGCPDEIVALHFVFCLQSVAYRLAVKNGKNPDAPGDLVPYIRL